MGAENRGFSGMAPMPGAPHQMTNDGFNATLTYAQMAAASYRAIHSPSP